MCSSELEQGRKNGFLNRGASGSQYFKPEGSQRIQFGEEGSERVLIPSRGGGEIHCIHSAEIVIIGADLAGAAAAYFLSQRGLRDVLLLEREPAPDFHASGRNTAMLRQVVPDPETATLARQGGRHQQMDQAPVPRLLCRQIASRLLTARPCGHLSVKTQHWCPRHFGLRSFPTARVLPLREINPPNGIFAYSRQ